MKGIVSLFLCSFCHILSLTDSAPTQLSWSGVHTAGHTVDHSGAECWQWSPLPHYHSPVSASVATVASHTTPTLPPLASSGWSQSVISLVFTRMQLQYRPHTNNIDKATLTAKVSFPSMNVPSLYFLPTSDQKLFLICVVDLKEVRNG